MNDNPITGLRERKKAATHLAIERAAIEIAYEQGYETATVEAIAAKANVSVPTFFKYFRSKNIAIVGNGVALINEERAHQILENSGGGLLKGLARIAAECIAEGDPTGEFTRRRHRVIYKNPPLLQPHLAAIDRFESWLTQVVADRERLDPTRRRLSGQVTVEEEARLAVMVISSAIRHQVQQSIEKDIDANLGAEDLEMTITMMAAILRENS